ncbi:hypothetical protein BW31_01999 [Pantoea agglomerans]|nr:hypothetical protein BW31_01999 [Pantoea agglomerans]
MLAIFGRNDLRGQVAVGIVDFRHADRGILPGLNCCPVIVELLPLSGGLIIRVQLAANVQIAITVDQRMVAVVQRASRNIQALPRRNHRRFARFAEVVEQRSRNGNVIAIDTAGAAVIQDARHQVCQSAVNQTAIVQGVGCRNFGLPAAYLAICLITDILRGKE